MTAEDWKSAFAVAESIGPSAQQLVARQRRLVHQTRGDAKGLLENGDVEGALNLLAANKEWSQCFAIAKKHEHPLLPDLLKARVEVSVFHGLHMYLFIQKILIVSFIFPCVLEPC